MLFHLVDDSKDRICIFRDNNTDNIIIDLDKAQIVFEDGSRAYSKSQRIVVPVGHFAVLTAKEYIYASLSKHPCGEYYVLYNSIEHIKEYNSDDIVCINRKGDTYINCHLYDLTTIDDMQERVNELQGYIQRLQGDIYEFKDGVLQEFVLDADMLMSRISDISGNYSLIKQDLDSIERRVYDASAHCMSSILQTADEIAYQVSDLSNNVYSVIDITARQITESVVDVSNHASATLKILDDEISTDVKAVGRIGCRNILRDADFHMYGTGSDVYWVNKIDAAQKTSDTEIVDVSVIYVSVSSEVGVLNQNVQKLSVGEKYTFSIYAKNVGSSEAYLEFSLYDGENKMFFDIQKISDVWTRYRFETCEIASENLLVSVRGYGVGEPVEYMLCKPQMERGIIMSDWDLCTDDIVKYTETSITQGVDYINMNVTSEFGAKKKNVADVSIRFDRLAQQVEGRNQIGTVNLLKDADFILYEDGNYDYWYSNEDVFEVSEDASIYDANVMRLDNDGVYNKSIEQAVTDTDNYIGYVFSIYAKSNSSNNKLYVEIVDANTYNVVDDTWIENIQIGKWKRYAFRVDETVQRPSEIILRISAAQGKCVYITKPQLERGLVLTDWTVNTEGRFNTVNTLLQQTNDAVILRAKQYGGEVSTAISQMTLRVEGINKTVQDLSNGLTFINQTADSIKFVKSCGGTNLLKGTDFSNDDKKDEKFVISEFWNKFVGGVVTKKETDIALPPCDGVFNSSAGTNAVCLEQDVSVATNQNYVLSYYVYSKNNDARDVISPSIEGIVDYTMTVTEMSGGWARVVYTMTSNDKNVKIQLKRTNVVDDSVALTQIKFEEGLIATQWSANDVEHRAQLTVEAGKIERRADEIINGEVVKATRLTEQADEIKASAEDASGNLAEISQRINEITLGYNHQYGGVNKLYRSVDLNGTNLPWFYNDKTLVSFDGSINVEGVDVSTVKVDNINQAVSLYSYKFNDDSQFRRGSSYTFSSFVIGLDSVFFQIYFEKANLSHNFIDVNKNVRVCVYDTASGDQVDVSTNFAFGGNNKKLVQVDMSKIVSEIENYDKDCIYRYSITFDTSTGWTDDDFPFYIQQQKKTNYNSQQTFAPQLEEGDMMTSWTYGNEDFGNYIKLKSDEVQIAAKNSFDASLGSKITIRDGKICFDTKSLQINGINGVKVQGNIDIYDYQKDGSQKSLTMIDGDDTERVRIYSDNVKTYNELAEYVYVNFQTDELEFTEQKYEDNGVYYVYEYELPFTLKQDFSSYNDIGLRFIAKAPYGKDFGKRVWNERVDEMSQYIINYLWRATSDYINQNTVHYLGFNKVYNEEYEIVCDDDMFFARYGKNRLSFQECLKYLLPNMEDDDRGKVTIIEINGYISDDSLNDILEYEKMREDNNESAKNGYAYVDVIAEQFLCSKKHQAKASGDSYINLYSGFEFEAMTWEYNNGYPDRLKYDYEGVTYTDWFDKDKKIAMPGQKIRIVTKGKLSENKRKNIKIGLLGFVQYAKNFNESITLSPSGYVNNMSYNVYNYIVKDRFANISSEFGCQFNDGRCMLSGNNKSPMYSIAKHIETEVISADVDDEVMVVYNDEVGLNVYSADILYNASDDFDNGVFIGTCINIKDVLANSIGSDDVEKVKYFLNNKCNKIEGRAVNIFCDDDENTYEINGVELNVEQSVEFIYIGGQWYILSIQN